MSQIDIQTRIQNAPPAVNPAGAPARSKTASGPATGGAATGGPAFGQVLQEQMARLAAQAGVKLSGHAQTRLASRGITLSGEDMSKLGDAITRAAAKGARESLVVMDKAALVVSVANRTVITAVDRASLQENIFTNIDSAMIL